MAMIRPSENSIPISNTRSATAPAPSRSWLRRVLNQVEIGPPASCRHAGETPALRKSEPLAVYIHWPFCRSKCPYCDFNSHVRDRIDEGRWTWALLADLERQADLAPNRQVVSIFFRGGTPSLKPPDTVPTLIERAKRFWP